MICEELEVSEGFYYSGKHSKEFNLRLIDRYDDPPEEKQIRDSVPFMQGDYDFSGILGQRFYENRFPTYEMLIVDYDYQRRKSIERSLSNWLMPPLNERLFDDFNSGYYYVGKCASIQYEDRYEGMTAIITFDAYPFKIGDELEGNDIWDTFNFFTDVSQVTKFEVNSTEDITLYNVGANLITPTIRTTSTFEIKKDGVNYSIGAGNQEYHEFSLKTGENELTITGNGTIEFIFRKEVL